MKSHGSSQKRTGFSNERVEEALFPEHNLPNTILFAKKVETLIG
jgi:hypothetical protein